ncbi:MAG: L-arabinose-binding periplasmic protein precursor AraF [Ilumatobacteraceae bacterium]|nr:L-arabinose-binding periplasmic protein precursor AraF [Ilumatobacteraceae bacterium]
MITRKYAVRVTALACSAVVLMAACGSNTKSSSTNAPATTTAAVATTAAAATTAAGAATTTAATATTAAGAATTAAGAATTVAGTAGSGSGASGTIALLLPESATARYESQDHPLFAAKITSLCAACKVIESNADQDAAKQQTQAEAALTNGAKVLVLDPVDAQAAASIVKLANDKKVPVVSYDRLIQNAKVDLYISFDNEQVGKLQAQALVDKLKADGQTSGDLVMINGSPTDSNAAAFKTGAHSVIDTSGFTVAAETDTVEWKPENAQKDMDAAIVKIGKDNIIGVYAANDGTAGGAIAAMKAAGMSPLPPVTGQDAEVAGLQRILIGEQYMTVYKAVKLEAEGAATAAIALLQGQTPKTTGTTNNGSIDVPSIILTPVAITKDTVKDVIADGFWKASDICTPAFASACTAAGIS